MRQKTAGEWQRNIHGDLSSRQRFQIEGRSAARNTKIAVTNSYMMASCILLKIGSTRLLPPLRESLRCFEKAISGIKHVSISKKRLMYQEFFSS